MMPKYKLNPKRLNRFQRTLAATVSLFALAMPTTVTFAEEPLRTESTKDETQAADYQTVFSHPADYDALETLRLRLNVSQTVKGDFTQYRKLKILKQPLKSQGRFIFQQDLGMVWQQLTPFPTSLILKQGLLVQKDSMGKVQVSSTKDAPNSAAIAQQLPSLIKALLGGDIHTLQDQFSLFHHSLNTKQWQLGLIPVDPVIVKAIPKMIIQGDTDLSSLILLGTNGDRTQIEFSELSHTPLSDKELNEFNLGAPQ